MKSLVLSLLLVSQVVVAAPAKSVQKPVPKSPLLAQLCTRFPNDSFTFSETNFGEEWAIECLNDKDLKILSQDKKGVFHLKESVPKSAPRAAFYRGKDSKVIAEGGLSPATSFIAGPSKVCGANLEIYSLFFWRQGKKLVQKATGICTDIAKTALEKNRHFVQGVVADTAVFEDYSHSTYAVVFPLYEAHISILRVNYAEETYKNLDQTKVISLAEIPWAAIDSSLKVHGSCGDSLQDIQFLPNSQKLLLSWLGDRSVLDYSNPSAIVQDSIYHVKSNVCAAVAYGYGAFDFRKQTYIDRTNKTITLVNYGAEETSGYEVTKVSY